MFKVPMRRLIYCDSTLGPGTNQIAGFVEFRPLTH